MREMRAAGIDSHIKGCMVCTWEREGMGGGGRGESRQKVVSS